ncbi:MAG: heavy metal translocating P-type ATPase metal-binding domain-containing protein [Archangiaceae bacterium]|nr:heavy metal translocating P-type ATPase metal-binding domain-containing protein [Archangiaceae bacterium]
MPQVRCKHCRSPIPEGAPSAEFCCAGCEAVYGLISAQGLGRFYGLAGDRVAPAASAGTARSHAWLEPLREAAERAPRDVVTLTLDVQGIQCAACVWLMNSLFQRTEGGVRLVVNPGVGRMELSYRKGAFDPLAWVTRIEAFGYRLGPPLKTPSADGLTWRLGVCAAITVNVMLFSVSFYFGLGPKSADAELYRLFTAMSLVLATASVAIGGWPFFRGAVRGLAEGVLHLDVPVALGITLVYATTLLQARRGDGSGLYLDTLSAFITLMLFGRWMQRRVIARNRAWLLEDAGLDGLVCRRVEGQAVRVVPASQVRSGDRLLIAPGELLPVDAVLDSPRARLSLEWISGESTAQSVERGASLLAGSFNASAESFDALATAALEASALPRLLERRTQGLSPDAFWNRLSKSWAKRVLTVAAFGFVVWLPKGLDSALDVAAAILVVTCPCAIGLAIPLAYELVQARLERLGFYARSDDLLDRLRAVRKVLFDKTGTLTLSRLELSGCPALTPEQRDAAYDLASRSAHPAAACIARELAARGARFDADRSTHEEPGQGVSSGEWRLGRRADGEPGSGLFHHGREVAVFHFREALRPHAAEQVRTLHRLGYQVWLVSGDAPERVNALAARLELDPAHVRAAQRPEDKAALVEQLDRSDTLFLGDGVNDALAFGRAFCAGTPAVDRPVMPSRAAFFFVGEGLQSLTAALALAQRLHRVVQRLVFFSLAYNVLAVGAALLGQVTPLRAAVFMPLSSLSLLAFALLSLRERKAALPAQPLQEVRA